MNRKIAPLVEYFSESTSACLVTMVQGNLLALTLGHLVIASQTGVIAGVISSITLLAARSRARWLISVVVGTATAIADFIVHLGQFGPFALEALVTGLGAALISYLAGTAVLAIRARMQQATDSD